MICDSKSQIDPLGTNAFKHFFITSQENAAYLIFYLIKNKLRSGVTLFQTVTNKMIWTP